MVLISGLGMIFVGAAFIASWARLTKVPLLPFLWGALLWVISVTLKFAVAIPVNQRLLKLLLISLHPMLATLIFSTYVGLLTGIFECAFIYFVVKLTSLREYNFDHAIAFGVGFGSIEAILLGLISLIKMLFAGHLAQGVPLAGIPIPIVERFFTILVHVFCSVLIFYSIRSRKLSYFLLSFITKTALDGFAGWFHLSYKFSLTNLWIAEVVAAIFGILSLYGAYRLRNKYVSTDNSESAAVFA